MIARATGAATSLRLYLETSSRASKVVLGLYADAGGSRARCWARRRIARPTAGGWNTAGSPCRSRSCAGRRTGRAAQPARLDRPAGLARPRRGDGGLERASPSATLTSLPATWAIGARYTDGPISGGGVRLEHAAAAATARAGGRAGLGDAGRDTRAAAPVDGRAGGDGTRVEGRSASRPRTRLAVAVHRARGAGPLPATVALTADPTGLAPGTYTATVGDHRPEHDDRPCR